VFNLVKAEFKKIFHKKSIYIVSLIFLLYCFLINDVYKSFNNYEYENNIDINEYIEINNSLDLNNRDDLIEYISNLSLIETEELKHKYETSSHMYLIDEYLYDLIYKANEVKYINKNDSLYNDLNDEINKYIELIKKDNWQYFANLKIDNLKNELSTTTDQLTKNRYQELIQLEEYRLDNNVPYDYNNFINNAILEIETNLYEYRNLQNKVDLSNSEKVRLEMLDEEYLRNKYILDNKEDINNSSTLQAVLQNFPYEFGIFILIYLILISASIVSEEFNKGTIKYLLTKPYKRWVILTAKFFTILLFIPLILLFMIGMEILIGGIIFGFDSLSIPVLIYNSSSNILIDYNIFKFLSLLLICVLPMYLILCLLCFMISVITLSTSAATTFTFLFYLAGNVISSLALKYDISILKFFISLHWDFSYLLDFSTSLYSNTPYNITFLSSIITVICYITVILCLAYGYFNKRDVKNI